MSETFDFVYLVRIKDGQVIDVPRRHEEQLIRSGKFEYMKANQAEPPKESSFTCPICGKTFKNKGGLNLHKRKHG